MTSLLLTFLFYPVFMALYIALLVWVDRQLDDWWQRRESVGLHAATGLSGEVTHRGHSEG